ncbi:S-layer homology domain-containing protein [Paenibacillus montanisoli]|uniref:S-layer homology domain-containing protein n=1 Tax=Paenibacillus montanisoli TaxID=2081970 RepID=A0A328U6J3_9BACL|nr:S-layer homology domain-containing protein [Paenibacillus montanisoli]RAP77383.1 S-layer homology domain-containing protein [Paenibacillus montanisoli]
MKKAILKKAAITSMALLTLAGGASSAFADRGQEDNKRDNDKHSINLHFKDEKELKWALEYIIRLASKGVFNGYEDGTFKPAQKISRIESIVAAVRLKGLKEQAESQAEMSTKLNFKDADLLKKKYPWAVGYVAVALENDLFSETESLIQPDKPATRLFAATLLVKALGLEEEAKAAANAELSFRDAGKIPAGSVGYVKVALEKGLIKGYEDRTFRPNQPVTRAELAALLDRTDEQLPDQDATAITGKLKAAPSGGAIVVVKPDNSEVALALDPGVFIFRDNVKAPVTALQAGDEVLVRTFQNKVVFIEVTKNAPAVITEAGKFSSLSLNAEGKIATISFTKDVNGSTQAYVLNVSPDAGIVGGTAAQLIAGQNIELIIVNNVVVTIKIVA